MMKYQRSHYNEIQYAMTLYDQTYTFYFETSSGNMEVLVSLLFLRLLRAMGRLSAQNRAAWESQYLKKCI